jgi:mono-ADP-ribosyltransferase sirtuin 6
MEPSAILLRACCWRACPAGGSVAAADARVEVAVCAPEAAGASGVIAWSEGAMAFHRDCWEAAARQRKRMSPTEKKLFGQASAIAERFDSRGELAAKAARAAALLADAVAIVFTGAGISTAAGLGDYRGKTGKWTLEAQGAADSSYTTEYEALRPTFAHECVAKLVELGRVGYVASQNADGLHRLSGIPGDKLSDVHGSAFTEYCPACGERYTRTHYVPDDRAEAFFSGELPGPIPAHIKKCNGCGSNHMTGRACGGCGAGLRDTVISFGDGLEDCVLTPAFDYAEEAGACLSLGSTMSIGPSNMIVTVPKGPLIVCVRQETEMDGLCQRTGGVRAFGDCDAFCELMMQSLLGAEEYAAWVAGLPAKKAEYDAQRPTAGKQRGDIFVMKT